MRLVGVTAGLALALTAGASATGTTVAPAPLHWAPPALAAPETITVPATDGRVVMDTSKDYVVQVGHLSACGGLALVGGRNVLVVGGEITIPGACASAYDRTAVKVLGNAGTVHLEGVLIDGPYTHDGIVTASPRTTLQIEDVRIEGLRTMDENHPDCVQTQAGLGRLRVDHFTCATELQGFFLNEQPGPVGHVEIRNTDITGTPGKLFFVQVSRRIPIALSNVWIHTDTPWAPFGFLVYPPKNGRTFAGTYNRRRRAVVSRDGKRLWFVGSNIRGMIRKGLPAGGVLVPSGVAGATYVSPGYEAKSS
jgi:hypothetical protein